MTRVLHILDHSLPQQSGYATRSQAILRSLTDNRVEVEALTSPKHGFNECKREIIDGICYWRTPIDKDISTTGVTGQIRTVSQTRRMIKWRIQDNKPDILHAHSPCLNGLAALGHGIPMIYEMRSSWEDAAVSEGITREGSIRYQLSRHLESYVTSRATEIVVICDGLRRELIGRGIPSEKITVVPNAIPERIFELPSEEDVELLRRRLLLDGMKVIGYFGSFFHWEGVEDLVRILPKVAAAVPNVRLLLAGGGRLEDSIRTLVSDIGMEQFVMFAGRVPAEDMPQYYTLADVMVYPRLSNRLTEMVTPLKPLEAMAQRTPVVASDIGGHRELICNGKTGFLFAPGDQESLCRMIVGILQSSLAVELIVSAAGRQVETERRWKYIADRYMKVYEKAICA